MNPENVRFAQFPIDLSRGIPLVEETDIVQQIPWLADQPSGAQRFEKFWSDAAIAGMPFAKGLFVLPLSSPDKAVPSRRGAANWDHPNAEKLVDHFIALMGTALREDCLHFGDLREQVKHMLSRTGLVSGSVALVFPLGARELAIWAVERDVERFVRRLEVEWIGMFPIERTQRSSSNYTAHWRRMMPVAFDLRNYCMPPEFTVERGAGIFWAGYAPTLAEKFDQMLLREATKLPVPFAPVDVISGDSPNPATTRAKPETELGRMFFGHLRDRRDNLIDMHPVYWARLYPRRYSDRCGYIHPKQIARLLLELGRGRVDHQSAPPRAPFILSPLLHAKMPHYFIAPQMFEGIARTRFPSEFMASETPLPLPGVILVLPDENRSLLGSDGTALRFVIVARIRDEDARDALDELIREKDPDADTASVARALENAVVAPDTPRLSVVGISESGRHIFELPVTLEESELVTPAIAAKQAEGYPPGLATAMWRLTKFVINTLLYLNLAPEYLTKERVEKTAKPKPQKSPVDYWTPNIYGVGFRLPGPNDSGGEPTAQAHQGRSPRGHIRSAHWRRQHFGVGNQQTYLVRIPWTWVEGENADQSDDDVDPQ